MSIEQLTALQQQFTKHLQLIRQESKNLPKSQTLRISAWLKKLCSVVDNYFWRKNRNLYTEVLALMLVEGNLQSPFDKSPPEGSLPKLTLYQIPFSVRRMLECNKNKHQDKQNNLELSNLNMARINSSEMGNLRCKKKQSLVLKSIKSMNSKESQYPSYENGENVETQRKHRRVSQSTWDRNEKMVETIEEVLHFLAKNNRHFEQDKEYFRFIEEIVEFGDEVGRNFRQLKFSVIHQ